MGEPEVLRSLLERVEGAGGKDRDIDHAVEECLLPMLFDGGHFRRRKNGEGWYRAIPRHDGEDDIAPAQQYTDSIDVAIALTERVLPGWAYAIINDQRGFVAYVHNKQPASVSVGGMVRNPAQRWHEKRGPTAALTILAAILSAVIAQSANPVTLPTRVSDKNTRVG